MSRSRSWSIGRVPARSSATHRRLRNQRRGLGRKIDSIIFEKTFPKTAMAKIEAMEKLRVNMPVTNRVRVTFDEPPIQRSGQAADVGFPGRESATVPIVSLCVVRNFDDDDDD